MCVTDCAECTPGELGVPIPRPFPGPTQVKLRTPEAVVRFRQGGLLIEADCSTDENWVDCGLHSGLLAM
eukprot:14415405-Alexandrium_andersonii.AAC.1